MDDMEYGKKGGEGAEKPDAEKVVEIEIEVANSKAANAVGQPPVPPEALPVDRYHSLVSALNDAIGAMMPGAPPVMWDAPKKVTAIKEPLPMDIWTPLAALGMMLGQVGGAAAEYAYDPQRVATMDGIDEVIGKLGALARDKEAHKAFTEAVTKAAPAQAGTEAPPEAPAATMEG